MSEIDVQRLKNDPAYWGEVAPEGAEVYIIDCDPRDDLRMPSEFFYADHEDGAPGRDVWRQCGGRSFWRKDCEDLEVIPRPTQWRGPEDGLPPVGAEVEAWIENRKVWAKVTVLAVDVDTVVWRNGTDRRSYIGTHVNDVRPLKSDKDRVIDAAVAATILKDGPRIRAALSDIYDAGLLRLPEEQS